MKLLKSTHRIVANLYSKNFLKLLGISVILAFLPSSYFAQLQNNNWTFGNGCRVNFNGPTPNGALNSFLFSGEQCATVSDP
ncbi:MAG: hypothetical protein ACK5CY_02905, partial [Bacteroidia bacterium]